MSDVLLTYTTSSLYIVYAIDNTAVYAQLIFKLFKEFNFL